MGFIHTTLPMGFFWITVLIIVIEMIVSVIWWNKWMVHFPEDDMPWDENDPFIMQEE